MVSCCGVGVEEQARLQVKMVAPQREPDELQSTAGFNGQGSAVHRACFRTANRMVALGMAAATLGSSSVLAAIDDPTLAYSLICASDLSVGFAWAGGRWDATDYRQYQYSIGKVAALNSDPLVSGQCDALVPDRKNSLIANNEEIASAHACYQISQAGSGNKVLSACVESWVSQEGGYGLQEIRCDLPRGRFLVSLAAGEFQVVLNPRGTEPHGPLFFRSGHCAFTP